MSDLPPSSGALRFAFLVCRDEAEGTWVARSVLTGHLAEGLAEETAVSNLQRTLDAAIYAAAQYGQSPRQWYDAQALDEPKHLATFARLVPDHLEARTVRLKSGNCQIKTSIATEAA